jgi:hypothetical protein
MSGIMFGLGGMMMTGLLFGVGLEVAHQAVQEVEVV